MLPLRHESFRQGVKLIRVVFFLLAILIVALSASSVAVAASDGALEGRLVNGTEGSSSVADQEVILGTYLNDTEVGSTATKTDTDGRFRFDGLSTEPQYSYQISLQYQGAEYDSEWFTFEENESTKSIDLFVYDSTTSAETIRINMSHTVVYVEEESLLVKDYHLFVNDGNRTYVGSQEVTTDGERETLRFSLPVGATDLQFTWGLMECCVVVTDGSFSDTMPVVPGTKEVTYSYRVGYNSETYTLLGMLVYPTDRFDLLVQGESVDVSSEQLTSEDPLDIEGTRFVHLSGENLARGTILRINLSSLPKTDSQGALGWLALVLILLAVGFGLGYPLARKRFRPAMPEGSLDQRRQRLLVDIAQLDDDFEGGKIAEEVYRRRRSESKAQLIELIQRSKEDAG